MNTRFIKTIDNKINIKLRKHIVLNRTETVENPETGEIETFEVQTFNPTDEMLFADGWKVYVTPELTPEQILFNAKKDKKQEVGQYDSSNAVNEFYISGMPVWLDKATRAGLKLRFDAEVAMGKTETTLWHGNMQFPLSLDMALQMLCAIEVYASACYDNTQAHLANIDNLETLEAVLEYEYTADYPEKLNF